jgi:hypothetical protein
MIEQIYRKPIYRLADRTEAPRRTERKERIIYFLQNNGWKSARQIAKGIGLSHCPYIRQCIAELLDDYYIIKRIEPYRQTSRHLFALRGTRTTSGQPPTQSQSFNTDD